MSKGKKANLKSKPEPVDIRKEQEEKSEPKKYILYEKKVDKFNSLAKRVEMTPAVCDECGLDLVALNDLGRWDYLDSVSQEEVLDALQKHKDEVHTVSKKRIISEDEVPTQWLGVKSRKRR